MHNANAITGTGSSSAFMPQFQLLQNAIASLEEGIAPTNLTIPDKEAKADLLHKLKIFAGHLAEDEQYRKELQQKIVQYEKVSEQQTVRAYKLSSMLSAVGVLGNRRTHSIAPLLMARTLIQNFDLIDSRTIRQPSIKEIKLKLEKNSKKQAVKLLNQQTTLLKQRKALYEQILANQAEISASQQQALNLMQSFISNKA